MRFSFFEHIVAGHADQTARAGERDGFEQNSSSNPFS
jgi:hypothetical protein